MKVEVESLDRVRKNIEVVLDDEKINELRDGIYNELKKQAKVKGFRPGKAPRSVLRSLYKDYVDDELKKKMVEETMGEALTETKVEPVSEPRIEFLDEENRFGYKMECEVEPEFDLSGLRRHRGRGGEDKGDRRGRGRPDQGDAGDAHADDRQRGGRTSGERRLRRGKI